MQDFGTKADNSPPPGGQLSAAEFNNLATENENAVLRSGQSLSGASATQLAQSLFLHGVKAGSFQDSGVANAYVATPVSGASGVLLPIDYASMAGAVISFKASNANSGASTLNIGQTTGTLIGSKAIVDQSGAALTGGEITAGTYPQLRYDPTIGAGSWVLMPWSSGSGRLVRTTTYINVGGVLQISVDGAVFAAAGSSSFAKHPLAVWADAEVQGSGGGGGSANSTAAGQVAAGSGGGGGGYARKRFTIAAINGQSITVGAGSAANTAGNSSAIGILVTASGGGAGINGANVTPDGRIYEGRPGGGGTGGDLNSQGGFGFYSILAAVAVSGKGGSSVFGDGASPATGVATTGTVGNAALSYGSGGSGAANGASVPASRAGGTGASGIIIIREYA